MRTDNEIERDVKDELQWDPDLDATDIAVSVKQSVVTLAGFVKSWSDKYEAEAATKRVSGVRGIANDLEVRLPSVDERPDPDIARDAVSAIKGQLPLSADNIRVVVKNGWVTLEGNGRGVGGLHFSIHGLLDVQPAREPISFDAMLQPSTLQYSVSRLRRAAAA